MVAALAWMVAAMVWRWATHRPVSGLLVLTLVVVVVRTALALATGTAFPYFVRPVFADLAVGVLFLGSLCSARPVIARLAPDLSPMEPVVAALPRIRALFRGLTLMWGVVVLRKAGITRTLLETLATVHFVVGRREGLLWHA